MSWYERKEREVCMCIDCKFYHKFLEDEERNIAYGECRRNPPTGRPAWEQNRVFPKVYDGDWCGEWKPRVIDSGLSE
jgi:hypothetical protein